MGKYICEKYSILSVVRICHSFCRMSSSVQTIGFRVFVKYPYSDKVLLNGKGETIRKWHLIRLFFGWELNTQVKSTNNSVVSNFFFPHTTSDHHTTCGHQPPTRGDNTVLVAQGGTATPAATKQLLPLERVFKRTVYIYIHARWTKSR